MLNALYNLLRAIFKFASGEFFLDSDANSGAIVFVRSLWSSIFFFGIALAIYNVLDPARSLCFSPDELREQVAEHYTWWGIMFAASYSAFYARFSSQWTYLANLYNEIKKKEIDVALKAGDRPHSSVTTIVAEWKAGFIEDSFVMHLHAKKSFASVIVAWGRERDVHEQFVKHCGGEDQWENVMKAAEKAIKKRE